VETIGSKRSYALIWCMPNNDDDDIPVLIRTLFYSKIESSLKIFCSDIQFQQLIAIIVKMQQ